MKKNYQFFLRLGTILKVSGLTACLITGTLRAQAPYCSSMASSTVNADVYNVMVNGVTTNAMYSFNNNCTTPAPGAGSQLSMYSNFKSLGSAFTASQLATSTFSVAVDECDGAPFMAAGLTVWIDYNQDNDFTDPGEVIYDDNMAVVSPRNVNGSFTVPLSALTGTTVMRVSVVEGYWALGSFPCFNYNVGETEDYIITILQAQPCSGAPISNTLVATSASVCPVFGVSTLTPVNNYTVSGISYQWMQSASQLGPWTNASGVSTQSAYTTSTLNATTYYQLVTTCAWGGSSQTVSPIPIGLNPTVVSTVPYFEGFEGIVQNNQMPNCSWFRSDNYQCSSRTASVSAWRQARTGNKFAEFDASNGVYNNTRYFYSNGIALYSGITYSASMWYNTPGVPSWDNLTLSYGPSQSTNGLIQLANAQIWISNSVYAPLSNTFNVSASGTYYLAVSATENYEGTQLVWDDLSLTAPCQFSNNAASIMVSGASAVCSGQSTTLTASGAGSYTWSTGATGNTVSILPSSTTIYTVTGTNTMTGCSGMATHQVSISLSPAPTLTINASKYEICEGESVVLTSTGATSYSWSSGATGPLITVQPTTTNTIYSVSGGNSNGCVASTSVQIVVNPLPIISIAGPTLICEGQTTNLTATGAGTNGTYQWLGTSVQNGSSASLSPTVTTTFTVTGTSNKACKGEAVVVITVEKCLGMQTAEAPLSMFDVYPNPGNGVYTIAVDNGAENHVRLTDVTGRIVHSFKTSQSLTTMDISELSGGLYYLTVSSGTGVSTVRIIKQ